MACNSNTVNFTQYTKTTKFKEVQIKNFYLYFKKFAKESSHHLTLSEFKNSLGILGVKANDFICVRLFELLCEKNTQILSFESYLNFMNLVNYGTLEEKITHTFKFFDIEKKGFINRENFRKIILSLCEYFSSVSSTQMKIREVDLYTLFDDILNKTDNNKLDLESFIQVSQNYPEILDFFDIFNNKILENTTLVIHRDSVIRLEQVIKQLKVVLDKSEKRRMRINSDVTLTLKSSLDNYYKNNKILEEKLIAKQKEINSDKVYSNYFLKEKENIFGTTNMYNETSSNSPNKNKMFVLSGKIKNKFKDEVDLFDDNEPNVSDFSSSSSEEPEVGETEELKDYVYELNQVGKTSQEIKSKKQSLALQTAVEIPLFDLRPTKTSTDISEELKGKLNSRKITIYENRAIQEDEFEFLAPADLGDLQDPDIVDGLIDNGIQVNECLIITNKKAFLKALTDIQETLKNVVEEIDPMKKIVKRRQGISINPLKESPLDKEDFLNSPFQTVEEKGMIHFGSENVELVLNMMIGIRTAVNSLGTNKNLFHFNTDDDSFKSINRFKFSQNLYDKEIQCRFYDFAPKVFYNIRKMYGIKNEDYIKSLGPENFLGNLILIRNRSLRELWSTGKSGSFFYYSYDSKFVLKTISVDEFEFYQNILEDYYNHLLNNPNTLLQRFYGLHTMFFNDIKMHFVIMNNVFNTNIKVHYKYDLKGSTYQRLSRKHKEVNYDDYDYSIPLKDLDFKDKTEKILLLRQEKEMISKELFNDSEFLASKNINDYSLLIGVHNPDFYNGNNPNVKQNLIEQLGGIEIKNQSMFIGNLNNCKIDSNEEESRTPFYENYRGGILSSDGKKIYFLGVIDIFTQYGAKKKFEHFFKSITQGEGISCKPPEEYSQRFKNFVREIFDKE